MCNLYKKPTKLQSFWEKKLVNLLNFLQIYFLIKKGIKFVIF